LTPAAGLAAVKRAKAGGLSTKRNRVVVAGASVLAVVAVGAVVVVPRLMGPSDPGCKEYVGTSLADYNKTINDLNAQASQATLSADMTRTVGTLTYAVNQTNSTTVKAALNGLLTELKTVQADVRAGSVPTKTVDALNNASSAADNAC
jgi:hypothetical protein